MHTVRILALFFFIPAGLCFATQEISSHQEKQKSYWNVFRRWTFKIHHQLTYDENQKYPFFMGDLKSISNYRFRDGLPYDLNDKESVIAHLRSLPKREISEQAAPRGIAQHRRDLAPHQHPRREQ